MNYGTPGLVPFPGGKFLDWAAPSPSPCSSLYQPMIELLNRVTTGYWTTVQMPRGLTFTSSNDPNIEVLAPL